MNSSVIIEIAPHRCAAYLKACGENTTKIDVLNTLSRMGITKGIYEDKITTQIFAPKKESVPIVKTVDIQNCITLSNNAHYSLESFFKWAQECYSVIQSGAQSTKEPFIHYCIKGKTVLTLDLFQKNTTIFNTPVFEDITSIIPVNSEHISIQEKDGKLHFSALTDGYLTIDFNKQLSLTPPFTISPDNMIMEGHLYPVAVGYKDLIQNLRELQESFERDKNLPHREIEQLSNPITSLTPCTLPLRNGKEAQNAIDAEITYKLNEKKSAEQNSGGRVNLKDFCNFKEVSKGEILLLKTAITPPVDGYTVTGEILKARAGKDIPITVGENVTQSTDEKGITYLADINGIFHFRNNVISVSEHLTIEDDAGIKTGNISYSKDIVIKGSVLSGYQIICGGNLTIENDIEDGVTIQCKGNLFVKNGIFGEHTHITVEGNLEVGFIQDSNCTVRGNMLIHRSILHSQISTNGYIEVEGVKVDKDKASIIGGVITTMSGLRAHSMGSMFSKTVVNCGFNPEMHKKFLTLHDSLKNIDMLLIKIQNSIGFNIRDKHNIKRLSHISDGEKQVIKEKLQKLKQLSAKKKAIEQALEKVKEIIYTDDKESLYVQIDNVISPEVTLYMCHDVEKVKTELTSVRYYLHKGEIKMINADEWLEC